MRAETEATVIRIIRAEIAAALLLFIELNHFLLHNPFRQRAVSACSDRIFTDTV